jgi:sterol desaturase/sphingolipid hydroxylase (fatty acid hydroxylase superfamily)
MMAGGVAWAFHRVWPAAEGGVWLPSGLAFATAFVALDYAAYWMHRLMHHRPLWRLHFTHHTVVSLNTVAAGRHSLSESLCSPLHVLHGLVVFLLADPSWYLIGVSTSFALDIWRHSPMTTHQSNAIARAVHALVITPEEHAVHHHTGSRSNFGANLKLWDRMHGTYQAANGQPAALGEPSSEGVLRLLLWGARSR